MKQPWSVLKKWIIGAIIALFIVDFGLIYITWRSSPSAVAAMRSQRDNLKKHAEQLQGDVNRGNRIRNTLGAAQKDYDKFYKENFLSPQDGYSAIESDLTALATKAGLRVTGIQFAQKEVKGRGVNDVAISENVEGNYTSLVTFIDGLEHSKYFYLLKDLRLDSASTPGGGIRLQLELHTYFRT
jgi:Tfp pilus assembly protein PilO